MHGQQLRESPISKVAVFIHIVTCGRLMYSHMHHYIMASVMFLNQLSDSSHYCVSIHTHTLLYCEGAFSPVILQGHYKRKKKNH